MMKSIVLLTFAPVVLLAADPASDDAMEKHRDGASMVADKQDELSADVQQLTIEQTMPKVIELLSQVEDMMDEATDNLTAAETGGKTIAAQTEIIEKIHEAAKEKQKQKGSESGSAMMDMMERMMGKNPDDSKKSNEKGKASDTGSNGLTGDSDAANSSTDGETGGKSEVRKVPKASGSAGKSLPEEFNQALDAYNRGAEKKAK